MTGRLHLAFVALAASGVLAAAALGAPEPVSEPVRVNPDIAGDQAAPSVAMAPDGSFAVAYGQDGEHVLVRRFGASASPLADPLAINDTSDKRRNPQLGTAADGRMVVVYVRQTSSSVDLAAQRLAADGTPQGAELTMNTTTAWEYGVPRLAVASDGRFVVTWVSDAGPIIARVFGADGLPATGELTVSQSGDRLGVLAPAVAIDAGGRFVVTWHSATASGTNRGAMVRRFTADGAPQTDESAVMYDDYYQNFYLPAVAMADDGSAIVVAAGRSGSLAGILAQRFDSTGGPQGAIFKVNDPTAYGVGEPAVAVDPDGDVVIAWEDQQSGAHNVALKQFAADGTQRGAQILAAANTGWNPRASIAVDGAARMAVAYQGIDGGGLNAVGVYTRRLNYGTVPPTTTTSNATGTTQPQTPAPPASPAASPAPPPSPSPTSSGAPTSPPARPVAAPALASVVAFPSTKVCASRRRFPIRLRVPRGSAVISATVKVNAKRVAVRKADRLRSTVNLIKLPKGRFTVAIELRLADGRVVTGSRRYRTCTPKRRGGRPHL